MRNRIHDRTLILDGAYQLVIKKGIKQLTARGLAKELKISTQPIYATFNNIESLRIEVLKEIFHKLIKRYFNNTHNLVDYLNAYVKFVDEYTDLYVSLITDQNTCEQTNSFFYEVFIDNLKNNKLITDDINLLFIQIKGIVAEVIESKKIIENQEIFYQSLYRKKIPYFSVLLEEY